MAPTEEPPALAYLERTLADSYRKEIDQEENVWRSLPFFAATLALQLAALFQIIDKLPDPTTATGWISVRVDKEPNHAAAIAIPASAPAGTTGNEPDRPIDQPSGSRSPTDASRH